MCSVVAKMAEDNTSQSVESLQHFHIAKLVIFENNGLTIGEQKNAIQNFYNPLLTEFRHMQL